MARCYLTESQAEAIMDRLFAAIDDSRQGFNLGALDYLEQIQKRLNLMFKEANALAVDESINESGSHDQS